MSLNPNENKTEKDIDLFDYLNVIVMRRRMIVRNTLFAFLAMAVLSLVLPKTYTAETTLLPPDDGEQEGLRSLLANAPISALNLPGAPASSSEIFVEILKSRSVAKGVLNKQYTYEDTVASLLEIWDSESEEEAVKDLHKKCSIFTNEQGIVSISVEMRDPKLAAQVANAFTAELDRVNQEKSISKAKNSRIYIEEQLQKTQQHLTEASHALAEFQTKYKAVDLEEQTKVSIEKAGELKGTILAKEVQFEVLQQTMKPDNPIILRLQKELEVLKKQYEHLQFGNSVSFEEQQDYFIPFADVPRVGLKLAELIRETKVQETVWQLLNQHYYNAKIQEARDTPTVQVLDEAFPPERKTKPRRKLVVLIAAFLTFSLSIFWAFVLEYHDRIRNNPEEYEKANRVITEMDNDYQLIKNTIVKALKKAKSFKPE